MIIRLKDLKEKYYNIDNELCNVIARIETKNIDTCINEYIEDRANKQKFNANIDFILYDTSVLSDIDRYLIRTLYDYKTDELCEQGIYSISHLVRKIADDIKDGVGFYTIDCIDKTVVSNDDFKELKEYMQSNNTECSKILEHINKVQLWYKGTFLENDTIHCEYLTDFEKNAILYLLRESGYKPEIMEFIEREFTIMFTLYDKVDSLYVLDGDKETFPQRKERDV